MRRRNVIWMTALLPSLAWLFLLRPVAGQQPEKLIEGPGADLVQAKCTLCHDIGNITRIRQTREGWDDTLKVMVRRGAPVSVEEASIILDYLTKYYGK